MLMLHIVVFSLLILPHSQTPQTSLIWTLASYTVHSKHSLWGLSCTYLHKIAMENGIL